MVTLKRPYRPNSMSDGRGQFPVIVKARASVELREAIKPAAAAEQITIGEFIRRALSRQIGLEGSAAGTNSSRSSRPAAPIQGDAR
jgi:hypothetical protein